MTRVLVTGATGFIGRHCLAPLLASGFDVHAVFCKVPPEGPPGVHWHQADLLDASQVSRLLSGVRATYLLHLAWVAVPGEYQMSSENLRWVRAGLDLLESFAAQGGRRVAVAGTCAEYDWRYGYCREDVTPLSPSSLYGACKHSLHLMLSAFATQVSLSATWGRLFFVYGPHEPPNRLVSSVTLQLLKGQTAPCSHGAQIRDFLFVQDMADALVALLGSKVSGPVNIASGVPVAVKDIIAMIAAKTGRADMVRMNAVSASAQDPPFVVADVSRLTHEVGWRPKHDLDKGLDETIAWWRGHLSPDGA